MRVPLVLIVGIAGLALSHMPAGSEVAEWPPSGRRLCTQCDARGVLVVPDGVGGAYVEWAEERNGNLDVYMQRVSASGDIPPGWPTDGLPVCTEPSFQGAGSFFALAPDGLGGVLVTWTDFRNSSPNGTSGPDIYAQRILANGSLAPGWPVDGVPVTRAPGYQSVAVVIADGVGGGFFSWDDPSGDVFVQHLTETGVPAAGWPADGLAVCTDPNVQGFPQLASDAAGGVIVVWGDLRDEPRAQYAQRVSASGEIQWASDGVRIVLDRALRELISDGEGGAYLACATSSGFHDDDYFVQRFTSAGTVHPGWPAGGVPVCTAVDERAGIRMVPDGSGGVLLAWHDYRDFFDDEIFVQRIGPDGTRPAGWPLDGLRVTDNFQFDYAPTLAPDGQGGAYLCWDRGSPPNVVCQHLTGAGTVAGGWLAGGTPVADDTSTHDARIIADGAGGAIAAWVREGPGRIRALRFATDGPVPVLASLVSAEVEAGRVRLEWYVADGASLMADVERRSETSDWERLATITPDGSGRLRYEDRAVSSGSRYAYRLSYSDGGATVRTAETWVTVPALRFALRGLTPNPSAGDPVVAFSLARGEPAWLELYDLGGRLIRSREVGSLGPGTHSARLDGGERLAAGVYSLRLRQGSQVATTRAVVLR